MKPDRIEKLWADYHRDHSVAARNALAEAYLPLVQQHADMVACKLPAYVDTDDLVQEGFRGLLKAIKAFDPNRGVRFATFASHRIRGAIFDYLRHDDWVPRSARKRQRLYGEQPVGTVSLSRMCHAPEGGRPTTIAALIVDPRGERWRDSAENRDAARLLLSWLNPRERRIFELRYYESQTNRQISQTVGVSETLVSRILSCWTANLVAALAIRKEF